MRKAVERAVAIAILTIVMAPSFLIFSATIHPSPENLPACCRRDGKHHCAMMSSASAPAPEKRFTAVGSECPFRVDPVLVPHVTIFLPKIGELIFAEVINHPTGHEQDAAALRVAEARSHQKRGPPANLPS